MKHKIYFLGLLIIFCSVAPIHAQTVNLSIAASMTDAVKEIIAEFVKIHPKADLRPNFASSGSLAKQIAQGAPADIYVSANPKWMKYLVERKFIASGTDRIFVFNKLVFISEQAPANITINDLPDFKRIAIGSPESVPAGKYAEQAMVKAGIFSQLKEEKKLILAKDVRQALMYADRGEVDGAFVYKTDALLARNAKIVFIVPDDLYSRVSYPLGLTVTGADNAMAKAFYQYLDSLEAAEILRKFGFEPNK